MTKVLFYPFEFIRPIIERRYTQTTVNDLLHSIYTRDLFNNWDKLYRAANPTRIVIYYVGQIKGPEFFEEFVKLYYDLSRRIFIGAYQSIDDIFTQNPFFPIDYINSVLIVPPVIDKTKISSFKLNRSRIFSDVKGAFLKVFPDSDNLEFDQHALEELLKAIHIISQHELERREFIGDLEQIICGAIERQLVIESLFDYIKQFAHASLSAIEINSYTYTVNFVGYNFVFENLAMSRALYITILRSSEGVFLSPPQNVLRETIDKVKFYRTRMTPIGNPNTVDNLFGTPANIAVAITNANSLLDDKLGNYSKYYRIENDDGFYYVPISRIAPNLIN